MHFCLNAENAVLSYAVVQFILCGESNLICKYLFSDIVH